MENGQRERGAGPGPRRDIARRRSAGATALAGSADEMATGNLDAALPAVEARDEVGRLTAAFHHMRDSLKSYIRDLRETTAAKERLESELEVARRIQADMLPKPTAGGPDQGYELAARLEVSGQASSARPPRPRSQRPWSLSSRRAAR